MFYEPAKKNHGLPYSPFKAIVAPRPIGWISTISEDGVANLAPYSFFNAVCADPDMVMFSSYTWKDSIENIEQTGEFVCNYVGDAYTDAMNESSAPTPADVSEFELAGLETKASQLVAPPRINGIPASLECRKIQIIHLTDSNGAETENYMVIGEVVGIHINDDFITDGRFDVAAARPLTRLGYMDYQRFGQIFELGRPDWPKSES